MTATEGFPDRHAPYSLAEVSVNCAGAPRHATPRGGGPPAVRAPLPPLECGLARPVRRSHAHVDAARTPGSHGAASRLMTLTSRRGATPQSRGTTPAAASFQEQPSPPPVVTSSPSSLLSAAPASTAQTPLINTLSAEPTMAGRAPATWASRTVSRRHRNRAPDAQNHCQVPKSPRGTQSRDREEKTKLRLGVRPWGAGRHLLGGRTAWCLDGPLRPGSPRHHCPGTLLSRPPLSLPPKIQGHWGHTREEGTRPLHQQGRAQGPE